MELSQSPVNTRIANCITIKSGSYERPIKITLLKDVMVDPYKVEQGIRVYDMYMRTLRGLLYSVKCVI